MAVCGLRFAVGVGWGFYYNRFVEIFIEVEPVAGDFSN
jgi:hypothetical protein